MPRTKVGICKRGHELVGDNRYVAPKTGIVGCRQCRKRTSKLDDRLFGGNREAAIQRDGEKCVTCGLTRAEHKEKYGYDITVDHIDGKGSRIPFSEKNNELSNLQTLCSSCHGRKDGMRGKKFADLSEEARKVILRNLELSSRRKGNTPHINHKEED